MVKITVFFIALLNCMFFGKGELGTIFPVLPVGVALPKNAACEKDTQIYLQELSNLTMWAAKSKQTSKIVLTATNFPIFLLAPILSSCFLLFYIMFLLENMSVLSERCFSTSIRGNTRRKRLPARKFQRVHPNTSTISSSILSCNYNCAYTRQLFNTP